MYVLPVVVTQFIWETVSELLSTSSIEMKMMVNEEEET